MVEHTVRRSISLSLAQAAIGRTTLIIILMAVLFHAATSPAIWTLLGVLVTVLFSLQLALSLIRGAPRPAFRLQGPALLYLFALSWAFLQTLPTLPDFLAHPFWARVPKASPTISATPIAGQHAVLRLATYGMIFWIAMHASINATRALWFLKAFALFSLCLAAFGLYATIFGVNPVLGEQATRNVSATFVNRNSYALYAAFGLVANLGIFLQQTRPGDGNGDNRRRALLMLLEKFFSGAWVYALGVVLCFSALLLTASRAGIASGLVGLLVVVIASRRDRGSSKLALISLFVLLGAFAMVLSEDVLARLFSTTSVEHRALIYREVLLNLDERILLGHGLGSFEDTFRPFVPLETSAKEWSHAHSSYLENLWEMGLPAALAFYVALGWIALVILRGALVRRRNRLYPIIASAFVIAGALHSLVDFSLQIPATAALFAFVLGVGWTHARPSRTGGLRRATAESV